MIDVLVVDDHQLVIDAIKQILHETSDIKVIGESVDGKGAIRLARALKPDVVLLDFSLPDVSGLTVTRKLSRIPTQVIILTAGTPLFILARLLRSGASGYITKEADKEELLYAIRCAHQKQAYLHPNIASQLALSALQDQKNSPFKNLTDKHLEIVLMLAQGKNSHTISQELYLTQKTINTYRYALFKKLGVLNDVEIIRLAKEHGLIDIGQ